MKTQTNPYLTTLTPLRGIAALFVVIFHSSIFIGPFMADGYTSFFDNAWLWVDFFFILSGFIMCYAYNGYFKDKVTTTAYWKYIGARFARIYPLNFVTAIWAFIIACITLHLATRLDPFIAQIINPKALPACLLLIQSMHIYDTPPLNTPSWSLSTEWWAYMLFPFIVPYFVKLKDTGRLVTGALAIAYYVFLKYVIGPVSQNPVPSINMVADFGFLRCLAGFFAGMLTFSFYERRAGFAFIKNDWFFSLFFFGVMAALHFNVMDILIIAFFPFIIITAAYNNGVVKRILDNRVLQRLGDWSFSIYMVHMPIIASFTSFAVSKNPSMLADMHKFLSQKPNYAFGLIRCFVIVLLTLLIASLTYRFVEIPSRNYFNKLFNTRQKKITTETLEV